MSKRVLVQFTISFSDDFTVDGYNIHTIKQMLVDNIRLHIENLKIKEVKE